MINARPRILVSRPDHLGDVLLTLSAVTTLRRYLPDAQIAFLTAPGSAEIPRHCPDVDQTLTVPFPPVTAEDNPSGWVQIVKREAQSLRGRFDIALLPRLDDPWSGQLVARADIPVRLGFDHPRTLPFLTATRPIRAGHVAVLSQDLALAVLDHLDVQLHTPPSGLEIPRFVPDRADGDEAMALLSELTRVTGDSSPIVLLPGSGWLLKNWPAERWGELAAELFSRFGVAPLVSGSPVESELVQSIVAMSGGTAHGIAGRLSIGGLAALLAKARLVVGTDNGPLHLAAIMGSPVVGLFGPADPREFAPLAPSHRSRIVRIKLPCSPCRLLLHPPCGAMIEPDCVTGISVDAVMRAVDDLLGCGGWSPPSLPSRTEHPAPLQTRTFRRVPLGEGRKKS